LPLVLKSWSDQPEHLKLLIKKGIEDCYETNLFSILKERDDFKERNEKLINANASLYQKIGVEVKEPKEAEEEKKPFDFRSVFDEKGNLKRK